MVVTIVMPMVVMIIVVFAVPVALMSLPALPVVVVVGMAPVGAGVGWPLPRAGDPDVPAAARVPVAIGPDETFCRHRRPNLIADRWRRRADVDLDLAECRNGQSRCGEDTA